MSEVEIRIGHEAWKWQQVENVAVGTAGDTVTVTATLPIAPHQKAALAQAEAGGWEREQTHDSELLNIPDPQPITIIVDGRTMHEGTATDAHLHTVTDDDAMTITFTAKAAVE